MTMNDSQRLADTASLNTMSDDDSVIDKFWGAHISAEKPLIYSLTGAQLSVTIVSLKAPTGTATLTVETPYSDAVAIAHLSKANPSSRVDLNFFPTDAQVTFTVTGATVALAGTLVPPRLRRSS